MVMFLSETIQHRNEAVLKIKLILFYAIIVYNKKIHYFWNTAFYRSLKYLHEKY